MKKLLSILLILSLLLSINIYNSTTARAYSLFTKSYSNKIQKGSKEKIYFVVSGSRVKWWTSNNKLKIVKKGKRYCIVKAKKTGKCYVKCSFYQYGKKYRLKKKIIIKKKSKVTYSNYLDIEQGMSFGRVKKILGNPYKHDSVYEYDDEIYNDDYDVIGYKHYRNDSYTWYNPFKSIYIDVDFVNWIVTDVRYNRY